MAVIDSNEKSLSITKRNEIPIANIYFKFNHHDLSEKKKWKNSQTLLTNKY